MTRKFLSLADVQELLHKSRTTIYNWRKQGLLVPVGHSGKSPLFTIDEVENFIKKQQL